MFKEILALTTVPKQILYYKIENRLTYSCPRDYKRELFSSQNGYRHSKKFYIEEKY